MALATASAPYISLNATILTDMIGVHSPLFQIFPIGIGLWGKGQKLHEDLLVPGFFTLNQEFFGVIRVFDVLMPVIGSVMPGDEPVLQIDAKPVRIGFEG